MLRPWQYLSVLTFYLVSCITQAEVNKPTANPGLLPQHCIFSAEFEQVQTLPDLPEPLQTKGKLYFNCNSGLIWQHLSPLQDTHIYTTSKSIYRLGSDEVLEKLSGRVHKNLGKLLTGIMAGDQSYLNRYFKTESSTDTRLELSPKKKRMKKFITSLSITKADSGVDIRWANNTGNSTLLKVSDETVFETFTIEQCNRFIHQAKAACDLLKN